ncbi:MAG: GIY-YIG nuclease family protein [Deltaproteobacteria bacterium]|nr:GIY-YIG nuclease family protein [Deltaproteobacteria bacterium]
MKKKQTVKKSGNFLFRPEDYPVCPGCYLMKNSKGQVIYAGKAKNLRQRLSYYFRTRRQYYKTKRMVPRIHDVEVILVNNETESLVLENNLIKHYKPRYNSMLTQDDVGYPFIVLTGEEYPRLLPYRRNWSNKQWSETEGQDQGKRFGPYLNKGFRDAVMNFAIETFGLRICRRLPKKVCFRYQLKKCSGICEGLVSPEDYREAVRMAVELLEYRYSEILARFREQMELCSQTLDFESAVKLRDRIMIIETFLEKQIVERDESYDQDVLFFGDMHVMIMEIKKGMLLRCNLFNLPVKKDYHNSIIDFISSQYSEEKPHELIVNTSEIHGKQIFSNDKTPARITVPDQGIKLDLLMLCKKNYEYRLTKAQGAG